MFGSYAAPEVPEFSESERDRIDALFTELKGSKRASYEEGYEKAFMIEFENQIFEALELSLQYMKRSRMRTGFGFSHHYSSELRKCALVARTLLKAPNYRDTFFNLSTTNIQHLLNYKSSDAILAVLEIYTNHNTLTPIVPLDKDWRDGCHKWEDVFKGHLHEVIEYDYDSIGDSEFISYVRSFYDLAFELENTSPLALQIFYELAKIHGVEQITEILKEAAVEHLPMTYLDLVKISDNWDNVKELPLGWIISMQS